MGDGKKLKECLKNKGTNVRRIAKAAGIPATTLYSVIRKDTSIRLDYALRLARELEIDVHEICNPGIDFRAFQSINNKWEQNLDSSTMKSYVINSLYPLLCLFGEDGIPDVHKLLTSFYQLDDEARAEIVAMMQAKLVFNK